jgi:glycosyltransferase involved in cell wall biosynthesis
MQNKSAVIAWNGLPYYAARLLSHLRERPDVTIQVIGSEGPTPRDQIEKILGQSVVWMDPSRPAQWTDLGLKIPKLFIHTGWAYPGFNSLARDVKRSKGSVVSMIDNNRKRNFRQLCGALGFRLGYGHRIDAAWVPGASGQELMRFFGFPDSRIYQGFYGADPEIFHPGPPLEARPKQFLFVGQFIPRKAPDLLLRAFERFHFKNPDWRLLMMGSGNLQASLCGTSVEILPFQTPDIVAEKLRQSRFLVLPSHEEHWGVVVHEATLSGCGLILSDAIGSSPDLLNDKNGYVFPVGDESALYHRLCGAANSSAARLDQISEESFRLGHRFGPEHFRRSFNKIVERLG